MLSFLLQFLSEKIRVILSLSICLELGKLLVFIHCLTSCPQVGSASTCVIDNDK